MNTSLQTSNSWLWFTVPVSVLLAVAAGAGVFIRDFYRDSPSYVAQARGQDVVSLFVVLPVMITSAWLSGRGSTASRLVWNGGLAYLLYTYIFFAFDMRFNSLFLVYVALLGCSLYALVGSLVSANKQAIKASFADRTPVRAISAYLAVVVVLFYFMWLSEVLPAVLGGAIPQSVQESGTPTNGVHVLDMAWILPALGLTAVQLWRRRSVGYTLAGSSLAFLTLLVLAILGMIVVMALEGQTIFIPQVVIFGTVWIISLGMLAWYLRGLQSPSVGDENWSREGHAA